MASSSSNDERDGGAKAALLQSFADSGVRPVLKGRIKSNQFPEMGPALFDPDGNLEQQAEGLGEPDHDKAASYRSDRDAVITQSNLKLDVNVPRPSCDQGETEDGNYVGKDGSAHGQPVANEAASSPQPLIDQQHRHAHNRGERERQPSNFERRHGRGT
jgi:hypothetical protein